MRKALAQQAVLWCLLVGVGVWLFACAKTHPGGKAFERQTNAHADRMVDEGREIFRYDTFGSEAFWGDQLRLHEAIAGQKLGGVGPGLTPRQALDLGLKVDFGKVPKAAGAIIKEGSEWMDDPEVTVALLKADAVVGVRGFAGKGDKGLAAVGIQCALCHSTVDDAFMPGIGNRLDGWPNRDLDIGRIITLAPNLQPFTDMLQTDEENLKKVLLAWGPGKFDAELSLDGKGFRPDGKTAATLNPPAFGLAGVNNHTWTGAWGTVTYWNAYVSNLQMHGQGTFFDPRLDNAEKYPVAARTRQGHMGEGRPVGEDRVTAKLPALHFYQLALPVPKAPKGAYEPRAAQRGKQLFNTTAKCATCHVPPIFTEPGWNLHTAEEIGIDDFQAMRAPDERYRTEPLRALWNTKIHKGGFYHDGRFATLREVVDHYNGHFDLNLSEDNKRDLIEYLRSL